MKAPELLSPAGTLKNMRYAFAYGADAVYAGMPRYSLRVRNNDFDLENLNTGISEAHKQGRQFFVAANVIPHNSKLKTFMEDMAAVVALKPDAFIMADPGLIMWVREQWPDLPVHLSVQANTVNYAAVKFWESLGVRRIILSRELSLDEIEEIRQRCPDIELEVFVHGALCIAYSGRCLLSGYFNHRDSNQGACTNACRWSYKTYEAVADETGDLYKKSERHSAADKTYLIEEPNRPDQLMPIFEDELGTYIMNSKDLRAVEHVVRLVEIGIDSLKIEGRTKSHYYVTRTAQIYRKAIDDAIAGRPFDPSMLGALESLANRGYTDGFYKRHDTHEYQNYIQGNSEYYSQKFVGEFIGFDKERNLAEVLVKNKICVGDSLEIILPGGNHTITLASMEDFYGKPMQEAPGGGYRIRIPVPTENVELGLLAKNLGQSASE